MLNTHLILSRLNLDVEVEGAKIEPKKEKKVEKIRTR